VDHASNTPRVAPPLTLQQLVGAAERLRRRDSRREPPETWLARVEDLRDRLMQRPFVPQPLNAFVIKEGAKERLVTSARPGDRLLEEALLPALRRALAPRMRPSVHGYRAGRSTFSAAVAVAQALASGHHHVACYDVQDFYGSIDRATLHTRMVTLLPAPLVAILDALVAAPLAFEGELRATERGIPLGRPVAPLLANAYLLGLDDAMADPALAVDVMYVRYADDLLVAARTPEARDAAEARIIEALGSVGLALNEKKTERLGYDGEPIAYLGHRVDEHGVYERVAGRRLARILQGSAVDVEAPSPTNEPSADDDLPNERSQTLYVTEPGLYLRMHEGLVVVRRGTETAREIPLHRVDRVLVLAGVSMTSGFLAACITARVPVLFFVGRGREYGSLVAGGMPNPLRLRAQYDLASDPARRLELGRAVVEAKIRAMLRRLANAEDVESIRGRLSQAVRAVAGATDGEVLRGIEGGATRAYYEGFAKRVKREDFGFEGRSRRPPRDPVNSLMSFAYSLLFAEMHTALLAHGLDPHPGVLHELHRNHPALASDLIEPYRPLIADSFVLTLVNNAQVGADGFEAQRNGGVYMTDETRRTVLAAWEAQLGRPAGGGKGTGSPRRLIHAAARAMLRVVLGEAETLRLPLTNTAIDDADALDEVFV
jgi:CRISPR-associated protein Cas1